MIMLETRHILTLLNIPGIGRRTVQHLLLQNLDFTPADCRELRDILQDAHHKGRRVPVPSINKIDIYAQQADVLLERSDQLGVAVLGHSGVGYPERLLDIPDPPVILYVKGENDYLTAEKTIAIIGTRNPTDFGLDQARSFGAALAEKGYVIVSGLALGCDSAAHKGCLNTDGQTIAVMAHGLDMVYPEANRDLARRILDSGGCLVSEYPPGERPRKNTFVERDRIQSGLSDGIIVIETDVKGGSMHTVHFSLEQGRPLACLAHPLEYGDTKSLEGNRKLIQDHTAEPIRNLHELMMFAENSVQAAESLRTASSGDDSLPDGDKATQLPLFGQD